MGKENVNSRNNWLSLSGVTDYADTRLDQYVLSTSSVEFNSVATTLGISIGLDLDVLGDATIHGNLTVTGSATIISTDITEIKDNIVLLNSDETGAGVSFNLSGVEIDRGSLPNYQVVFEESTTFFKVGQIGSLQAVATRQDTPLNYGVMIYNPLSFRLDSTQTLSLPMTFSGAVESTTSGTGTVIVNRGIGATGNVCIDGYYAMKGTDYTNKLSSNVSNDMVATVGRDFSFIVPVARFIKIPTNVYLSIGTNVTALSDDTTFTITNSTGNINLTTISNGSVKLPNNTYLAWTTAGNNIRYNSTNMELNSTGNFTINPQMVITNATPSTSTTAASLLLSGGMSSSIATDATSSSLGGGITLAGGAAIKKKMFIGDKLTIADTIITTAQTAGQGINFRSLNRIVTTSSTNDFTLNSFEGGSIATSAAITNASSVYITGAPTISSGGGSITNSYALYINSGNSYLGGKLTITDTTASTSYTTGAMLLSGGLAINKATNAVSYTNGGGFSNAGGMAVGMDIYSGGKIDVANVGVSTTQVTGEGVNFRSRSRVITTTATADLIFNSFEGGAISTASNITNSATVYITGSPTISGGGVLTNSYSLLVGSGTSLYQGKILVTDTTAATSSVLGSINTTGGISSSNATDATSHTNGGGLSLAGGAAIAKKVYTGLGYYSNSGLSTHLTLQTTALNRISISLANAESGSDVGSDFTISRYTDLGVLIDAPIKMTRSTGSVSITGTISSTSYTSGQLVLQGGGISINCATNASGYTVGGSLTSLGGFAFDKDGYINGTLNVNTNLNVTSGVSTLGQTTISTTNGQLLVSGANAISMSSGATSSFTVSSGNLTLEASSGSAFLNGSASVSLTSSGGAVSVSAAAASNFTTTVGKMTIAGIAVDITGGSGVINIQNSAAINIITTDTTNGVKIATTGTAVPITIGDSSSLTTINGSVVINSDLTVNGTTTAINSTIVTIDDIAFVVNNQPAGLSDGGFLIHRYQPPSNTVIGEVVQDTPKVSSTFQSAGTLPDTLVLNVGSSAVDDYYRGWWITITSGDGINQVRRIRSYIGSSNTALLFDDTNTTPNGDGLDLVTAPALGDSYELYDVPYAGVYYSSANREIRLSGVPFDQGSGVFGTPTSYLNLHANSLILEEAFVANGFSSTGLVSFLFTDPQELVVGKTGAVDSTGYIFTVDTTNGLTYIANPINTVSSFTGIYFQQLNSLGAVKSYSSILSIITDNTSGATDGTLKLSVAVSDTLTDFITISGGTALVDFSTAVNSVRILNTTASTSSITGGLILSSGLGIDNSTDATSITNGGAITNKGGLAVAKKIFVGGGLYSTYTSVIGSSNTISGTEGSLNSGGDITLYNGTSQGIYFNGVGSGAPSFTTRSVGSKLILKPSISGSAVDSAIGISSNVMWYSVADTSSSHTFYLGTTIQTTIDSNGITINNSDGIRLNNGSTNALIYSSTDEIHLVPHTTASNFIFRNSADSLNRVTIDSNGTLSLGLSAVSGAPSTKLLDIQNYTFTDSSTSGSGTATAFTVNSIGQTTLAASNSSVTTTTVIGTKYIGAPIQGTNETFTNAYTVYIGQGSSLGANTITTAASLYIQEAPTGTSITNKYSMYVDGSSPNYINSRVGVNGTTQVGSSNALTINSGTINTQGDITLYNSTKQGIYFSANGSAVPAITARSVGSKLILLPSISGSSVDSALGISTNAMWYSVGTSSSAHSFYLGTSKRFQVDNTGILLDSSGTDTLSVQRMTADDTGLTIAGGSAVSAANGAYISLYGDTNSVTPGSLNICSGSNGAINMKINDTTKMSISNGGNVSLTSTTDTTNSNDGSFYTPGGIEVDKSVSIGSNLYLNFNQLYTYSGDSSGRLNIQSGTSAVAAKQRIFTADGDGTDDNLIEMYAVGTPVSLTNTEYLSIGYNNSGTSYSITTNETGTGTVRALILQTGANTDQLKLNANGTLSMSDTLTTQKVIISDATESTIGPVAAALIVSGGIYCTKDLRVAGNLILTGALTAGLDATQSITISNIVNSGTVTPVNIKTITNGNEVLLTCAFQFTPTAVNTRTSFYITVPFVTTNFVNLYDVVFSLSGFMDNAGDIIDISNLRGYPITGAKTANIVFTSGSVSSKVHTVMLTARYTKG